MAEAARSSRRQAMNLMMPKPTDLWRARIHRSFQAGIWLKGINGGLELLAGSLLLLSSRSAILHFVMYLTQQEILEDPRDRLSNFLIQSAEHLSIDATRFAALYLVLHGSIKIGLVAGLLRKHPRSFPVALVALTIMVSYQSHRWLLSRSLPLGMLTIVDIVVIALIWVEWRQMGQREV
jgi:uncharacterized membrane protein